MFPIESQGAVDIVAPATTINHENATKFFEAIAQRPTKGQPMLVIDLSGVPLIDSAGLEALLDIQQSLYESGGTVKLAAPSQLCQDIFRVTGIAERFETYSDAKAAVRSFVR